LAYSSSKSPLPEHTAYREKEDVSLEYLADLFYSFLVFSPPSSPVYRIPCADVLPSSEDTEVVSLIWTLQKFPTADSFHKYMMFQKELYNVIPNVTV
jgi:hypothetical protein